MAMRERQELAGRVSIVLLDGACRWRCWAPCRWAVSDRCVDLRVVCRLQNAVWRERGKLRGAGGLLLVGACTRDTSKRQDVEPRWPWLALAVIRVRQNKLLVQLTVLCCACPRPCAVWCEHVGLVVCC